MFCAVLLGPEAGAQQIRENLWVADGDVNAVVISSGVIYLGGKFTQLGRATGCLVALDATTGAPDQPYPLVTGSLSAIAQDGSGGWYLGGSFTAVLGTPRNNLAHIDASGHLTSWNPNANDWVACLAVSGNTIYAGGTFTNIGGQSRNAIAALDAVTGAPTSWDPSAGGVVNPAVHTLALRGNKLYAGGFFGTIGGGSHQSIAALDATTGEATSWSPNANGSVEAMVMSGSTIYVAGGFTNIGSRSRFFIAALDTASNTALTWNPSADGFVLGLVLSGNTIYAGGYFGNIGGQPRNRIAALDATSGAATNWDASASGDFNSHVQALVLSGSTLYVGGDFSDIGGQSRNNIAALDVATGAATSWNPNTNDWVIVLAVSGNKVWAGGLFTSVGGTPRKNIAAIDEASGAVTSWNPGADSTIYALAVSGNTVYAGGLFGSIGGAMRSHIGALSTLNGTVTSWNPNASDAVYALAVSGSTVYAGGSFTSIGGQTRNRIAALDGTGNATAWDPSANFDVHTIVVNGSTVYVGGGFTSIGGQTRNRIAALDVTNGSAMGWDPNASYYVFALVVRGNTVYAGGGFDNIGGQPRNLIAAIDATSGLATAWDPNASGSKSSSVFNHVSALAVSGGNIYAGGTFNHIGGQTRNNMAALDVTSGAATNWNPDVGDTYSFVSAVTLSGGTVYVGGKFVTILGTPHSYFAGMSEGILAVNQPAVIGPSDMLRAAPNPFQGVVSLDFRSLREHVAEIGVYDVTGKLVRRLQRSSFDAGIHRFNWDGRDETGRAVGAGLYFVRVRASGLSLSTKVLRLR